MALTRNSPIKSDPPAMTKPSSSSPPPPALSLDDDNVTTDKVSSSPSLKRRKIVDDDLEQKKIPAADTNKSQNKNSVAPAAAATLTTHAAAAASDNMETIDVANILGLKPGDRIEVKWNINDEEEDDPPPPPPAVETGKRLGLPKTEGEEDEGRGGDVEPLPLKSTDTAETDNTKNAQDTTNSNSNSSSPAPPGMISVWWKATVQKASGEYHILDDNDESAGSPLKAAVQQPPPPPTAASSSSTDKNQTYNCPKCPKQNMSKQGLYTHYGMVHGGKISRDYPNLLSQQQQQRQQHYSNKTAEPLPTVRIPIYEIVYDPLPSLGFPDYSNEEVAFISNVTLLNLSSEEMMNFRREGEVASPLVESVIGVGGVGVGKEGNVLMKDVNGGGGGGLTDIFGNEAAAAAAASKPTATTTTSSATSTTNTSTNPNEIYKEFRSEDDIRTYMNELMQKSMMSTGMNARMATLPRSQQNVIAGRINKALEGLLGKMMEEMGRMEGGSRVVTADVVRRCMEQMRPV